MDDFKELLARVAAKFGTRKSLADALDMDASRLSRAVNTGDFPFNVENCLRLAKVSGEPASDVLRAAGKSDIAELIETLYGPEKHVTDTTLRDLLAQWPTFTADEKTFVRLTIATVLRGRAATPERDKEHARRRRRGGAG